MGSNDLQRLFFYGFMLLSFRSQRFVMSIGDVYILKRFPPKEIATHSKRRKFGAANIREFNFKERCTFQERFEIETLTLHSWNSKERKRKMEDA